MTSKEYVDWFYNQKPYFPTPDQQYKKMIAALNKESENNKTESASSKELEIDHAAEREVMIAAFDKVRKLFESRSWIIEGRGSYPYDDDKYKEEVRYLYEEFDQLQKETWANIKSKTFEYRQKVIQDWEKDCEKSYICNGKIQERANLYASEIVIKYGAVPYIDLHARIKEAVLHGNALRKNSAGFDVHISKDILRKIGFEEDRDGVLCYQNILYYVDEGVFQFAIGYAPLINIRIDSFFHLQNLIYWVFKIEVSL